MANTIFATAIVLALALTGSLPNHSYIGYLQNNDRMSQIHPVRNLRKIVGQPCMGRFGKSWKCVRSGAVSSSADAVQGRHYR